MKHKFVTEQLCNCLLYTSDAADEEDSVDLGGGRVIKKKNMHSPGGSVNTKHNQRDTGRITSVTEGVIMRTT